jgi:hypothetical protein
MESCGYGWIFFGDFWMVMDGPICETEVIKFKAAVATVSSTNVQRGFEDGKAQAYMTNKYAMVCHHGIVRNPPHRPKLLHNAIDTESRPHHFGLRMILKKTWEFLGSLD